MYVGVDTHEKTHVLVMIDEAGRTCDSRSVANTRGGRRTCLGRYTGRQERKPSSGRNGDVRRLR